MRKEFNMMLIVVVCAILGIVCAVIVYQLYTNGILIDEIIEESSTISIDDLMFIVFFAWLFVGIVIGVFKS
jgi:hypothetical protein